jgi:hypothetical protein
MATIQDSPLTYPDEAAVYIASGFILICGFISLLISFKQFIKIAELFLEIKAYFVNRENNEEILRRRV